MKYAKINGTVKHINKVKSGTDGICPICNSLILAKKGSKCQYFAHRKGEGDGCSKKYNHRQQVSLHSSESNTVENTAQFEEYFKNRYNNIPMPKRNTKQQEDIINCTEQNIIVNATAGSGKTHTLQEYCKAHQDETILYLVYNKSMQLETKERFRALNNVEVRTIHSLAYKCVGYKYKRKLTSSLSVFDMAKSLDRFIKKPSEFELMDKLIEWTEKFNTSVYTSLKEFCDDKKCDYYDELKKYYKNPFKVTHDFYLKKYQVSKPTFDVYDTILVDEAQDINGALLGIVEDNKDKNKFVLVGDENQAIYQFAGAVNAFKILNDKWTRYPLSNSFRIGNTLAKLIGVQFDNTFGLNINIKGLNINQKITETIDQTKKCYTLARTNTGILLDAIPKLLKGDKIYVEGGSSFQFKYLSDLLKFYNGKKVYRFNSYENYDHLKSASIKSSNLEFMRGNKLIQEYGNRLTKVIRKAKQNIVKDEDKAKYCYSTIHKSKGKTINMPLRIIGMDKIENYVEEKGWDVSEVNLLFVALTRAKDELEIPPILLMNKPKEE